MQSTNATSKGILLRSKAIVGRNLPLDSYLESLSACLEGKIGLQLDALGGKVLSGEVVTSRKKHDAAKDVNLLANAKIAPGIILAATITITISVAIAAAVAVPSTAPRRNVMARMTTAARLETRLGQLAPLQKLGELFTSAIVLMDR